MTTPAHHIADEVGQLPAEVFALGFSLRKRPLVRRFLSECSVRFVHRLEEIPAGCTIVLWGSRQLPDYRREHLRIVRLEDGFLRSVGLGADLVTPLSWVADKRGIYYDATAPSDLEVLLQRTQFSPTSLGRASRLRAAITQAGLSKYNSETGQWSRPSAGRVVLVPGQVERDASIRFGAAEIKTNTQLLEAVREACPRAYVVYKPHPDVTAGLRQAGSTEHRVQDLCDEIVTDVDMSALLAQVDEVHTMTSLTGFEALLRARTVVTYGQPFYAGWGLTTDRVPHARRTRSLSIDELVAGALLTYPRYASRKTGRRISAESALQELLEWRTGARLKSDALQSVWRAPMRQVLRWAERP